MAHATQLSESELEELSLQVAESIAELAPNLFAPEALSDNVSPPAVHLAKEAFECWILEEYALKDPRLGGKDLEVLAKPTGRLHHQVRVNLKGEAFARTAPSESKDTNRDVRQLLFSPIAPKIDEAIEWIDDHVAENYLVRLLMVPAYQVTAFWLFDEQAHKSKVLTITAPSDLKLPSGHQLLNSSDFISMLLSQRPISGISP